MNAVQWKNYQTRKNRVPKTQFPKPRNPGHRQAKKQLKKFLEQSSNFNTISVLYQISENRLKSNKIFYFTESTIGFFWWFVLSYGLLIIC